MIKDLEESRYYDAITSAMEKTSEEKEHYEESKHYYVPYMEYAPYMMRDEDWRDKHMYNGRSSMSRRMYMEGKDNHETDTKSIQDLERYVKDLSDDMVDMIKQSTPEEKQLLSTKLQQLASKVNQK